MLMYLYSETAIAYMTDDMTKGNSILTVLVETNVLSLLSEALTADVQAVLSDQTGVGSANSALSRTLTVVSWVGEPNVFVSHDLSVSMD